PFDQGLLAGQAVEIPGGEALAGTMGGEGLVRGQIAPEPVEGGGFRAGGRVEVEPAPVGELESESADEGARAERPVGLAPLEAQLVERRLERRDLGVRRVRGV